MAASASDDDDEEKESSQLACAFSRRLCFGAASSSCLSSQEIERLRMDGASSVTIFPIERFKYVVRPVKEVTVGVAMGLYNIGYSRRGEEEPR